MQILLFDSPSNVFGAFTFLCVIFVANIHYCVSQRNPPQGASRSGGQDLYTYGRGDIPIFNPGDPGIVASLKKLIIAIRYFDNVKVKVISI